MAAVPGPSGDAGAPSEKKSGTGDDSGHMYEYKMALLVFLRCLNRGLSFTLNTNGKKEGKFDDVVLELTSNTTTTRILTQLKHVKTKEVTKSDLLAFSGDFSVPAYFKSYRDGIDQGPNAMFVLYTNTKVKGYPYNPCPQTKNASPDSLLLTGNNVTPFSFTGNWEEISEYPKNLEVYKQFLKELEINCKDKDAVIKCVASIRRNKIPEGNSSTFPARCLPDYEILKKHHPFKTKIELLLVKGTTSWSLQDLIDDVQKLGTFDPNKYKEFLDKFKFYSDQANVNNQLDDIIKDELRKYVGVSNVDEEYLNLVGVFHSWWRSDICFSLNEKYPQFHSVIASCFQKLSSKKVSEIITWPLKLNDPVVEEKRLTSSEVVQIFVRGTSTLLAAARVYYTLCQREQNMIMVSSRHVTDNVLNAWKSAAGKLLVLEFDYYSVDLDDLTNRLIHILKSSQEKRLIMITKTDDLQISGLFMNVENSVKVKCSLTKLEENTTLLDFVPKTRHDILKTEVDFQGFRVQLCDIVGDSHEIMKHVNDQILEQLIYKRENVLRLGNELRESKLDENTSLLDLYKDRIMSRDSNPLSAEKWVQIQDVFVTLTGEPGMGKSTLITRTAKEIKESQRKLWVAVVDLNECSSILHKLQGSENVCVEFMKEVAESIFNLSSPLEKCIFETRWKVTNEMILLIDGYDEVCPYYEDVISDVLNGFKLRKIKMLITTRAMYKEKLDSIFETNSFHLHPFTRDVQKSFLCDIWKKRISNLEPSVISECTAIIVKHIDSILDDTTFMEIPLHIVFVADMYEEKLKNWESSGENNHLSWNLFDITQFLKRYFLRKYEIYFEKMGSTLTRSSTMKSFEDLKEIIETSHQKYAVLSLVSEKYHNEEAIATAIKDARDSISDYKLHDIGIIRRIVDNKPAFIINRFAEFHLAKWLHKHFEESKHFIERILSKGAYGMVICIFNRLLSEGYSLHLSIMDNSFQKHLAEKEGRFKDYGGRTALHVLAFQNTPLNPDYQFLLNHVDVRERDKVLGWTALRYADKLQAWHAMDLIMQKEYDDSDLILTPRELNSVNYLTEILITSSLQGYASLLKFVVEHIKDGNIELVDERKQRPIHVIASSNIHDNKIPELFDLLIHRGADLNCTTTDGQTPLHLCAEKGSLKRVEYLVTGKDDRSSYGTPDERLLHVLEGRNDPIGRQRAMTQRTDRYGRTALDVATNEDVKKYLQECAAIDSFLKGKEITSPDPILEATVRYLIEVLKADANACDANNETPLHHACKLGNKEIVEYLFNEGAIVNVQDKKGNSPLHAAVTHDHTEIVAFLVNQQASKELTNDSGDTPLKIAVNNGNISIVEYLGIPTGSEAMVLLICARKGYLQILKHLFKKISNVSTDLKDANGNSALYLAALHKHYDIVEYLIDKRFNVKILSSKERSVLHAAVLSKDINIVKFVKERGCSPVIEDTDGNQPIHLCALCGNYRALCYFVEECKISACLPTQNGKTLLHTAAEEGHVDIVRYLVEKQKVNVSARDNDSKTAMDLAVLHGRMNVVMFLADRGIGTIG